METLLQVVQAGPLPGAKAGMKTLVQAGCKNFAKRLGKQIYFLVAICQSMGENQRQLESLSNQEHL